MAEAIQEFVGTEDWFSESTDRQKQALDIDFNNNIANTDVYQEASPDQQKQYRTAYDQLAEETVYNSEHNPENIQGDRKQQKANSDSYWGNWGTKVKESHKNTVARAGLIDDSLNADGQVDDNASAQMSRYYKKENQKIYTKEEKQLASAIQRLQKRIDKDGFLNDAKAWGEFIFKDIPANMGGVGHLAADSAASLTTMGGGAKVGAMTAAGLTAATGGIAAPAAPFITAGGMFAAEVADAGTSKFLERIRGELTANDIPFTPSNIQMFLDNNPDLVKATQKDSLKYGSALGAVDVALGGFFSKLSSLPTKVARREAMRSIDDTAKAALKVAAKEQNISLSKLTELTIDGTARQILKGRSFKSKLGSKAVSYGGEVLSEPASEAVATAAAGEENTATNLINETLGGIGAGPYGAAINTAAFGTKLASKKSIKGVKGIVTPSTEAQKKSKKINKSRSKFGFNKEVKEATDDTSVDQYSDPESEKYDPIKAVAILGKSSKEDAHDKATEIYSTFVDKLIADGERADELQVKLRDDRDNFTKEDEKELRSLGETLKTDEDTAVTLGKYVDSLDNKLTKQNTDQEIPKIDVENASGTEVVVNIIKSLGSGGNKGAITNKDLGALEARNDLSPAVQAVVSTTRALGVAIDAVKKASSFGKNSEQVNNDVLNGKRGSDFKGIHGYMRAITGYVSGNNKEAAQKHLDGLKKFTQEHKQKSARATALFKLVQSGDTPTAAQQKHIDEFAEKGLVISKKSGKLVNLIHQEAVALLAAVSTANSLMQSMESESAPIGTDINGADSESTVTSNTDLDAQGTESTSAATIAKNVDRAIEQLKKGDTSWVVKALVSPDITEGQRSKLSAALKEHENANKDNREGDRRKLVSEMTVEELRAALLTNELTGIPNRRAYDESSKGKVQASIDGDSLKWINDNMGHAIGDQMLKGIAQVLQEELGTAAFHISGDEFVAQGDDINTLMENLAKADKRLQNIKLEVTLENGDKVILNGLRITYGIDTNTDLQAADRRLAQEKEDKELAGNRAGRGQVPKNVEIIKSPEPEGNGDSDIGVRSISASRRKMEIQAHGEWNRDGLDIDKRLKDKRIFDIVTNFFEFSTEKNKPQRIGVDDGNGTGGTQKTVVVPSTNPVWVQELYKELGYNHTSTLAAITKALTGKKKLTVKQQRAVTLITDAALDYVDKQGKTLESIEEEITGVAPKDQETNESSQEEVKPVIVSDALEAYESTDMSSFEIETTDAGGNKNQQPFDVAIEEINQDMDDLEQLKNCLLNNK